MGQINRISILTNAPISQNPRVVKEADALATAGYVVTVIYGQDQTWTYPLDVTIANRSPWLARSFKVGEYQDWRGQLQRHYLRLRRKLFALLSHLTLRFTIAERAMGLFIPELVRLAVAEPADLYIGHNPAGLVAAAWAARRTGARYAFDAEDFHTGQYPDDLPGCQDRRWVDWLERKYLPGCRHVTAAAPGMARALRDRYGIPLPLTLLNTFPWADRKRLDGKKRDRGGRPQAVTFYWFSQIVSLDRGLQDVIVALARVQTDAALHIRGRPVPGAVETLWRLATQHGVADRLIFHELVPPEQLLSRAAEHDVGLCLEQPLTLNRDLCVTNKLFIHLLAGNAVIATATQGQREMLEKETEAAFLYPPEDVDALARIMTALTRDPVLLARAKKAALLAAESKWNWEIEQQKLIELVGRTGE